MSSTVRLNDLLDTDFTPTGHEMKPLAKRIVCKDGATLSVQASKYHYCQPREDRGPYYEVEVGFPSVEPPASWAEYMDGDWETQSRTDTVYGYVPIDLVEGFIEAHGGSI